MAARGGRLTGGAWREMVGAAHLVGRELLGGGELDAGEGRWIGHRRGLSRVGSACFPKLRIVPYLVKQGILRHSKG